MNVCVCAVAGRHLGDKRHHDGNDEQEHKQQRSTKTPIAMASNQ